MTAWACDTSVAIAALDPTHEAHPVCRKALVDLRPVLAGHAAFETYSVLTRLPIPLRLSADQAASVLAEAFPGDCWLDAAGMRDRNSSAQAPDFSRGIADPVVWGPRSGPFLS